MGTDFVFQYAEAVLVGLFPVWVLFTKLIDSPSPRVGWVEQRETQQLPSFRWVSLLLNPSYKKLNTNLVYVFCLPW